jgi:hypothetical protein
MPVKADAQQAHAPKHLIPLGMGSMVGGDELLQAGHRSTCQREILEYQLARLVG